MTNLPLYRIADWDALFESSETRKLKHLQWVPTPNKHDGLSFRRMARQPDRCELFSAWNLMLQVASKSEPRGSLERHGNPLTAEDLADMTGFPDSIFVRAFKFFLSEGWLTCKQVAISLEAPAAVAPAPIDDEAARRLARIVAAHDWYNRATGGKARLDMAAERLWFEFFKAGHTEAELKSVIAYLRPLVREKKRNEGALKLESLIALDRFSADLNLRNADLRSNLPPAAKIPLADIRSVLESRGVTEAELVACLLKRQLITEDQLAPDGEPTMLEDIQKVAPAVIQELLEYPTGLIGIIQKEKERAASESAMSGLRKLREELQSDT